MPGQRDMYSLGVKLVEPGAKVPTRMTAGSAGFDLYSCEDTEIPPTRCQPDGQAEVGRALVSTGLVIELPPGTVGRIASRSGLSVKANIETGAGWIDSDYRGTVKIELKNFGSKGYRIKQGDRIAQLVVLPVVDVEVRVVPDVGRTDRGGRGFGSTGA
ncbi:MAG: dUTP diphosphatase [Dehalococcoidia bacterium]|nr:dUTP diphosphatase [Dehalococcoidia bacterium]